MALLCTTHLIIFASGNPLVSLVAHHQHLKVKMHATLATGKANGLQNVYHLGSKQKRQKTTWDPCKPAKFITTLHPSPALESGQNRASPMNVRDHHSISRGGEVLQCLAPSRVSLIWMDPPSIGMRRILPAIGSSTDRGVGLKMRNTEGSISWSRVLHRSI
jgi:hypothetical protein